MIKRQIKKLIPKSLLANYREFKSYSWRMRVLEEEMKNRWLAEKIPKPKTQKEILKFNEFKIYSQEGDDGILNYIFSKIKTTNKKFVEFGIEDGKECNTANLLFNFGWEGLLIEGDKKYALDARKFYRNMPVKIVNSFITKDNINKIFEENNLTGEIDLLSIDIDGNDYWIWKAIDVINPRVVVMEYNSAFKDKSITIKYDPNFVRSLSPNDGLYYGTSLTALTKLAKEKGYILIGCCSGGVNAYFIRKDIVKGKFKELSPSEAFYDNEGFKNLKFDKKYFNSVKDSKLEEI